MTNEARAAAISLLNAVIGALSALALTALVLTTWRLARRSLVVRHRLALSGVAVILALTAFTDWPNDAQSEFWQDHALLSGALTSLLLVGAGLLILDTKAERESAKRDDRVRQQVTQYVTRRGNDWLIGDILERLRFLGCKHHELILVDGDFNAWQQELRDALRQYVDAFGEGADLLFAIPDEKSMTISEALLAARAAAHELAVTDATELNFVAHLGDFVDANRRAIRLLQSVDQVQRDIAQKEDAKELAKALRRHKRVNLVRRLIGQGPLFSVDNHHGRGRLKTTASLWNKGRARALTISSTAIERVKHSQYLRQPRDAPLGPVVNWRRPIDAPDEELISWLLKMVGTGKAYEYRAVGIEAVLGLVDYMLHIGEWDVDDGWNSDDVNLLALRLGLADPLPRNESLLNVPTATLADSGFNRVYELPRGALDTWRIQSADGRSLTFPIDAEIDGDGSEDDDYWKRMDPDLFV